MFYSNSETVEGFRQQLATTCAIGLHAARIILWSVIVTMVNDKIKNKNTQTFQFFGIFVSPFFHRAALHLSVVHTSVCVYIYRFHCRRVFRTQWRVCHLHWFWWPQLAWRSEMSTTTILILFSITSNFWSNRPTSSRRMFNCSSHVCICYN